MTDLPSSKAGNDRKKVSVPAIQQLQQELKKIVPDKDKREQILLLLSETRIHSGPLPTPEQLAEYDKVVQGLAERIVSWTEKQAEHRMRQEDKVITGQLAESKVGQIMGFTVGIAFLIGAVFLGYTGHDWLAGTLATVDIVGLVTAFITGRQSQKSDLAKKG